MKSFDTNKTRYIPSKDGQKLRFLVTEGQVSMNRNAFGISGSNVVEYDETTGREQNGIMFFAPVYTGANVAATVAVM